MRNPYLKDLEKIEFVITNACTGRCKHCSEGDHAAQGERIDPTVAADVVRKVTKEYDIKTVMAFGGEPLLYPDAVYSIISAARESGVSHRQVITNGFFSRNEEKIAEVVKNLAGCGVNDLLLSVDAFHQETIPLSGVMVFAKCAVDHGIPIRLSPAWLVSREHDNPYNNATRNIISEFAPLGIPQGLGNVIFPEGNAKWHLAEYFTTSAPENPYIDDPCNVKCLSFSPNGDILHTNIYKTDILKILDEYSPDSANV